MYTKLLFSGILIVILFASCENENPIAPENFAPVLSNLSAPDTVKTGIGESSFFSVKCIDENGAEDIDHVAYKILSLNNQQIESGIMYDDGNYSEHGDNVPGDGKFSIRLKLEIDPGSYQFVAQATDRAKQKSNELAATFYALPGIINQAPIISKNQIPDSVFIDQVIPFFISVKAYDPDSSDFISNVTYQILGPTITQLAEEGSLNDSGANGDDLAGDGIYSIETTTAFANWKFGEYHLIVQAYDNRQKQSESIYVILPWAKKNIGQAPQILKVTAPDTVQLPASGDKSFTLAATVIDPDDNRDIKEVIFNTFKPDGSPSGGNPFKMYDDGTSGDATANDFIFSLQIFITSQNSPGNYRFEFLAKDYSDLISDKMIHIITVIK
jgi:hypothetical protein